MILGPLRRSAGICGLVLVGLSAGCVSIYDDKIRVQKPEDLDPYQRNVLDKCKPHLLPHRLIRASSVAETTVLTGEGTSVDNQAGFDAIWNSLAPDLSGVATAEDLKPVINWEVQTARFFLAGLRNSCEKIVPYGMETDCYQISLPLQRIQEGTNCITPSRHPVFIYIYPKTKLPLAPVWLNGPYIPPADSP